MKSIATFMLSILIAVFYVQDAKAQKFGLRTGMTLAEMDEGNGFSDYYDVQFKPGFMIGAEIESDFNKIFSIQSGIFYTGKGVQYKSYLQIEEGPYAEFQNSRSLYYIEIPVYLKFTLDLDKIQLYGIAGFFGSVGITGSEIIHYPDRSIEFEDNKTKVAWGNELDQWKRLDWGPSLGFAVQFQAFDFRIYSQTGWNNISNNPDARESDANFNFAFTLGYRL